MTFVHSDFSIEGRANLTKDARERKTEVTIGMEVMTEDGELKTE